MFVAEICLAVGITMLAGCEELDNISAFIPVTDITDVPAIVVSEKELILTGTVLPTNATNMAIVWSVVNADTTGATITGDSILNIVVAGMVTVRATITNGTSPTTDYTQDFTIIFEFVNISKEKVTVLCCGHILQFNVVIGSFANKTNAISLIDNIANIGYNSFLVQNEVGIYRVIIATFDALASAVAEIKRFRSKYYLNFQDAWILDNQ